jgi:hypothetical protein
MTLRLSEVLQHGISKRVLVLLESFPFFFTGVLEDADHDFVTIGIQEGVPIQLVGKDLRVAVRSIAAFFVEDHCNRIPVLENLVPIRVRRDARQLSEECSMSRSDECATGDLAALEGYDVLFVLRPAQLSILGQVFRPILVGEVHKAGSDLVLLKTVNIRFSSAPDFVFPLPLYVPLRQIASFTPFDRAIQFPLV